MDTSQSVQHDGNNIIPTTPSQDLSIGQTLNALAKEAEQYRQQAKQATTQTKRKYFTKKLTTTTASIVKLLVNLQARGS